MHKSLQDFILNQVRKDNVPVTVYLVNGFQIFGLIKSFDNYVVVLDVDGKLQMVYKHAISTVIPTKPFSQMSIFNHEE